jgi:hypothetical protein
VRTAWYDQHGPAAEVPRVGELPDPAATAHDPVDSHPHGRVLLTTRALRLRGAGAIGHAIR